MSAGIHLSPFPAMGTSLASLPETVKFNLKFFPTVNSVCKIKHILLGNVKDETTKKAKTAEKAQEESIRKVARIILNTAVWAFFIGCNYALSADRFVYFAAIFNILHNLSYIRSDFTAENSRTILKYYTVSKVISIFSFIILGTRIGLIQGIVFDWLAEIKAGQILLNDPKPKEVEKQKRQEVEKQAWKKFMVFNTLFKLGRVALLSGVVVPTPFLIVLTGMEVLYWTAELSSTKTNVDKLGYIALVMSGLYKVYSQNQAMPQLNA